MKDVFSLVHTTSFNALGAVLDTQRDGELARAMGRMHSTVVLPMPTTVYAFMFNSCVYESAAAVVSLHVTKRGALRAMIAHQYAMWERAVSNANSNLHCSMGLNTRATGLELARSNESMYWRGVVAMSITND